MTTPTGILFSDPQVKPLSTVGQFQAGCYLCFFLTGTATPANVYADGLLTTPLSQPTPGSANPAGGTVADSSGRFSPIYMNSATIYRVQLYNAAGAKLEDTDPVVVPFGGYASQTFTGGASDVANIQLTRTAAYSGGTVGFVNSALRVTDNVTGTGITSDEWALTSVLNNYSNAGENVAIYGQGSRMTTSTGPTWAGTFEVRDESGQANPTVGLVGLEVDCRASGADNNSERIGIDVVVTRYPLASGAAMQAYCGVRVQNGGDTSAVVDNCFAIQASNFNNGFTIFQGSTGFWGINMADATLSSGAILLPSPSPICFDANAYTALYWDGTNFRYDYGTNTSARTHLVAISNTGSVVLTGQLGLNGNAAPAQITGFGTPVGGAVINNYNITDAGGANSNTNKVVAEIVAALKAVGIFGA